MDSNEKISNNLLNDNNNVKCLVKCNSRLIMSESMNNKGNHQRVIPIGLMITFLTFYLIGLYMQRTLVYAMSNKLRSLNEKHLQSTIGDQYVTVTSPNCLDDKEYRENLRNRNCIADSLKRQNSSIRSRYVKSNRFRQQQKYITTTTTATTTTTTPNTKSAEPIIYLFALIFIYLLIKAASDINEHYKTRNRNDKRLRRCSLQSYAQMHGHMDRRTSKDPNALKINVKQQQQQQQQQQRQRQLLLSSMRSLSFDQNQLNGHYFDAETMAITAMPTMSYYKRQSDQMRRYSIAEHLIITRQSSSNIDLMDTTATAIGNDCRQQRRVRMINRH